MATTGAANTNQRRQKGTIRKENRCLCKLHKFGNFRDWETSRNMWCESVCTGFERSMRLLNNVIPNILNLASQDHVPIGTSSKQCSIHSWDATCYMHHLLYATVICDISYVQGCTIEETRSSISCHITWITYIWMKFWRNQMPKWSCETFQVSQISKGCKSGRKKSSHWIHVCKVPCKPFLYPSMWWYRIYISLQIYHWPCMYHSEKPGRWSPRFSASRQMLRWKPHHDHRGQPENMCVGILRSMCPCLSGLGLDIWCSLVSLKWNTN